MKTGFRAWFSSLIEGSAICRGIGRFGSFLYKKLGSGLYRFLFGSYDTMCETFDDSAAAGLFHGKHRVGRYLAANIEESVYVSAVSGMMRYFSRLSLRVIGIFLMSCGFYSSVIQLVLYLVRQDALHITRGVVSAALLLLGIPLLFSGKALCTAVHESTLWNAVFSGFCGFKERSFAVEDGPTGRKSAAFALGLPFGILACFISPVWLLLGCIGLIAAYIVLVNPECGLYLTGFALPFLVVLPHPSILLALLTLYTTFAFVIKLIRGKRYFKPELLDILVFCFMAAMLLGGFVSYGGGQSVRAAGIYTILMLGYFLAVGLLNTKEKLKKAAVALCVSLLLVSLYGVYQNLTGNISAEWIDTEMFDNIGGRVVSTFENPNMLGEYLILLLPIVAALMLGDTDLYRRIRLRLHLPDLHLGARRMARLFACRRYLYPDVEPPLGCADCRRALPAAACRAVPARKYRRAVYQHRRPCRHLDELPRVYLARQYAHGGGLRADRRRRRRTGVQPHLPVLFVCGHRKSAAFAQSVFADFS